MGTMKVLSLFSGVGGFDMGLENAGMDTVFQCEWDKHANTILHKHWPTVPKWEDVSTLTGKHILANAPVVDVVAWGSPCQDLSAAGSRSGLKGERSELFHEGIRIIKELREETNGEYPRISIWENVVGALNSNRGADFGIIIDEMAEAGAMVIEWTVLDAQYWLPQRRKRVFVIAIFDPGIANICPDPLLPVSKSLRGHPEKSESKRENTATDTDEGFRADSRCGETILTFDTQFGSNANVTENIAPTLKSSQAPPSVAYPIRDTEPTMAIRRLTPLECERIMGWPDDHTRYKADGTEQAVIHRYTQCGNGVASPVAQWIGKHLIKLGQQ